MSERRGGEGGRGGGERKGERESKRKETCTFRLRGLGEREEIKGKQQESKYSYDLGLDTLGRLLTEWKAQREIMEG